VIVPVVGTLTALILFLVQRALTAQAQPVSTGAQGLVGEVGEASTELNLEGKVFVHGEFWNASSPTPIRAGEKVRVKRVDGLRLIVEQL
jgi:membrane-bound serine protease (ClpP class)